ncbi:hypothetical protein HDU91_006374 [Kappamyces sp. JEL0680]|nr:hypothetical protein HDU91_006374 [Kappamyces sp. JEL0680]
MVYLMRVCRRWHQLLLPKLYEKQRLVWSNHQLERLIRCKSNSKDSVTITRLSLGHLSEHDRYSTHLGSLAWSLLSNQKFTNLTVLDLSFCKGISNSVLVRMAPFLRGIQTLNLAGGGRSDACLLAILRNCQSSLQSLNLSWNVSITDATLVFIGIYCSSLKSLDLSGCSKITDLGLMSLSRDMIRHLPFTEQPLTEQPLVLPVTKGSLECTRSVSRDPSLLPRSDALKAGLTNSLERLNIACCNSISSLGIDTLFTRCSGRVLISQQPSYGL